MTEIPIRTGGNLYCVFCGRQMRNRESIDADFTISVSHRPDYPLYGEVWECEFCKKPFWAGTKFPKHVREMYGIPDMDHRHNLQD